MFSLAVSKKESENIYIHAFTHLSILSFNHLRIYAFPLK